MKVKVIEGQINIFNECHKQVVIKQDKPKVKPILKNGMFIKCIDDSAWFGGKFEGIKKGENYKVKYIINRDENNYLIIETDNGNEIALNEDRFIW